jgi:hypothetical protein
LFSETIPTPSDGTYGAGNIKVEDGIDEIEESFIAINKEAAIRIKQEEIPEDKTVRDINTEPDEVSYVCVCLLDTFYLCPEVLFTIFFCEFLFLTN